MNSRSFHLYRNYTKSPTLTNVGDLSWSWSGATTFVAKKYTKEITKKKWSKGKFRICFCEPALLFTPLSPVKTDATWLANNSQHCWMLSPVQTDAQHCWPPMGVPRYFLFVSLGGAYWGEIQYGRDSAHKESPRRDMLWGSGDMPSRKIQKSKVLWDVIWCNLGA